VNADGTPVTVYIDEAAFPGVHVESITYQGNGSDFTSSDAAGTSSFNIGIGVNTVTFDNEPNPPGEVGRNV